MEQSKDQKIYYACERIRGFCFMRAGKPIMRKGEKKEGGEDPGDCLGAKEIINSLNKGSLINSLIASRNWEVLFANDDWLSTLEMAQNLNSLEDGTISEQLKVIAEFFPEETMGCIFADILP